jgi:hypothetical protein
MVGNRSFLMDILFPKRTKLRIERVNSINPLLNPLLYTILVAGVIKSDRGLKKSDFQAFKVPLELQTSLLIAPPCSY